MKDQKSEKTEKVEIGSKPEVLGQYTGERIVLTQDQMLGLGGGARYYEIEGVNSDGTIRTIVHVAMPALLKHRPHIKAALRKHAEAQITVSRLIKEGFNFDAPGEYEGVDEALEVIEGGETVPVKKSAMEILTDNIADEEEKNIDALLEIAYYCFLRTDITIQGKSMAEAKEILQNWLDEGMLKRLPETAMGINKLERPLAGAGQ